MENNDILNKTSLYDVIKESTPELLIPDTDQDFIDHRDIIMSKEEYYVIEKFNKEHKPCRILPDGRHRFGAIGGGFEKRAYLKPDGSFKFICRCAGCNEILDVDEALKNTEIGEIPEDYKYYNTFGNFDIVEWTRFKKFCEDHTGHNISVGFMGTGLGFIIVVKDEDNGEYADITNSECW